LGGKTAEKSIAGKEDMAKVKNRRSLGKGGIQKEKKSSSRKSRGHKSKLPELTGTGENFVRERGRLGLVTAGCRRAGICKHQPADKCTRLCPWRSGMGGSWGAKEKAKEAVWRSTGGKKW